MTTTKTTTLASAMAQAFGEIEAATKSATNPHFKSKYADLGAVIDAVKTPLIKHGLFFTQRSHPAENGVSVETVLHHEGGEELSLGTLFVPADKTNAQAFGSALTYARRYGLMTAFGVPAEDDDGNAAASAPPKLTGKVNPLQYETLQKLIDKGGVTSERFCKRFQIAAVSDLPASKFTEAKAALENRVKEPTLIIPTGEPVA